MDDIDEELLGLMGDEAEAEPEPEPASRKRTSPPTSVSPASKKTKTGKGVAKATKRRRRDTDDEESDVSMEEETDEDAESEDDAPAEPEPASMSESEDELAHPYPLEGKYRDAADKARILAMSEIDREKELAERATQVENLQQDRDLRNMLRNRQKERDANFGAAAETRRSTRAIAQPHKKDATKLGQLAEIKKSREDKGSSKRGTGDSDAPKLQQDMMDLETDTEKRPRDDREVTVEDINKARMGRSAFHKLSDYPGFQRAALDCFVRVSLFDQSTRQSVYRVGVIKGFTSGKPYDIKDSTRRTDQYLKVAHGHSERSFPMDMMSDKPITDSEFRRWKTQLDVDKIPLPTLRDVQRKKRDLIELDSYVLTDREFDELIERRKRFKVNHLDMNMKRSTVSHALRTAQLKGDLREVARLQEELADIERAMERQRGRDEIDEMSRINEKIRKENRIKIRNAEIAEKRARREAQMNPTSGTYDPFLRVKTKVKTVFEPPKPKSETADEKPKAVEAEAAAAAEKEASPTKPAFLPTNLRSDALIASLDLGIDDDLDLGDETTMGADVY